MGHELAPALFACVSGSTAPPAAGTARHRLPLRTKLAFGIGDLGPAIYTSLTTFFLFVLIVGLIFYFVPNTPVRLRDVWPGAVLTAVLWRAAYEGFSWYARSWARASVHGSIATVVWFLIWIYISAVLLLYGVEFTAALARIRRERRGPAVPLNAS